jgi:hypothetical protein
LCATISRTGQSICVLAKIYIFYADFPVRGEKKKSKELALKKLAAIIADDDFQPAISRSGLTG